MRSNETLFPKKLLQGAPCSGTSREKELSRSTFLYSLTQRSTSHLIICCVFFSPLSFPLPLSSLLVSVFFLSFYLSLLPCFPSPLRPRFSPPHLPLFTAFLHHPVFLCFSLSQPFAGLQLCFCGSPTRSS